MDTHRHCSAAADEQAHALHCGREHTLPLLLLLRMRSNQPDIHGRHAHEHARHEATTAAYVVPNLIRVEFGEEFNAGAGHEGAEQSVDEAVHVVQGQTVEDDVLGRPLPGIDEDLSLVSNCGKCGDAALGARSCAAGVHYVTVVGGGGWGEERCFGGRLLRFICRAWRYVWYGHNCACGGHGGAHGGQ